MRPSLRLLAMCGAACAALTATGASATNDDDKCKLDLSVKGDTVIEGYDALAGGFYAEPIILKLENKGRNDCAGFIVFSNTGGDDRLRNGQNRISYSIVDENNIATILFDPSIPRTMPLPVMVRADKKIELRPRLYVDGGQGGPSGTYRANIQASFETDQKGGNQQTPVKIAAVVRPSVQANFVGVEGRSATLDLGELSPQLNRSIGVQIRASTDVDVEITSENRGNLKRTAAEPALIPYTMQIGGIPTDLTKPDRISLALFDSVRGATTNVSVTVGAFNNAPVGTYRDLVEFRISAR